MTYAWSVAFTKLAMLALYHRIDNTLWYRIVIYVTGASILVYQIIFTILIVGPCEPSKNDSASQNCLNRSSLAHSVLNIASDIFVILIPVPTVIKLKMPLKQKMMLMSIIGLGSG